MSNSPALRLARVIDNSRALRPAEQRIVDALLPYESDGACTGLVYGVDGMDGAVNRAVRGVPRSGWFLYDTTQACAVLGARRVAQLLGRRNAIRRGRKMIEFSQRQIDAGLLGDDVRYGVFHGEALIRHASVTGA